MFGEAKLVCDDNQAKNKKTTKKRKQIWLHNFIFMFIKMEDIFLKKADINIQTAFNPFISASIAMQSQHVSEVN